MLDDAFTETERDESIQIGVEIVPGQREKYRPDEVDQRGTEERL